jgi:elongator complex protein 1
LAKFPEFCHTAHYLTIASDVSGDSSKICIGLAESGNLFAVLGESGAVLKLAASATSYTVASDFAIFTTTAHEASFVPLSSLIRSPNDWETRIEKRRVERGSRIVTAVPSAMSLVLQMPRGNLETIYPRPLVMQLVKRELEA